MECRFRTRSADPVLEADLICLANHPVLWDVFTVRPVNSFLWHDDLRTSQQARVMIGFNGTEESSFTLFKLMNQKLGQNIIHFNNTVNKK